MNIRNACYPSITDSISNIFVCVDGELYGRTLHKSLFDYLHLLNRFSINVACLDDVINIKIFLHPISINNIIARNKNV